MNRKRLAKAWDNFVGITGALAVIGLAICLLLLFLLLFTPPGWMVLGWLLLGMPHA